MVRPVTSLSVQVATLSTGHSGNATAMGELRKSNSDLQAAIVRMAVEVGELRSSLSSSVAGPPAVFWVRLLTVPASDPAVSSTATAFLVAPTVGVVDGLKDAVVAKMRLGVAAPLLEVWAHDAVTKRWVPVDEDAVLVANDKATAYHVVVPKA